MDYRVVSYGGSFHRPVFMKTDPIGLSEISYLDEVQELTLCLDETEGSPMVSEPQIFRSKIASLSNKEVSFEIHENIIIIPNFTPGKCTPKTINTHKQSYSEGATRQLLLASGTIPENATKHEHLSEIFDYAINVMDAFDRGHSIWSTIHPRSSQYVRLPDTIDWSTVQEGDFVPFGVPIGKERCTERFEIMKSALKTESLKDFKFNQEQHDMIMKLLKLSKNMCPGLVQRDYEIDLFVRNELKSCLIESLKRFIKGLGKSNILEELHREIRNFATVCNMINVDIPDLPMAGTAITIKTRRPLKLLTTRARTKDGQGFKEWKSAAIRLNFQTRTMVM